MLALLLLADIDTSQPPTLPLYAQLGLAAVFFALLITVVRIVWADMRDQRDRAMAYAQSLVERLQERDDAVIKEYTPALLAAAQAIRESERTLALIASRRT